MIRNQTYFMVLVNDIIKDYSLDFQTARTIAQGYRNVITEHSNIQILEVKSVKLYDVI